MVEYVTYIRVSTERQGQSGLGLEAQQQTIADYLSRVRRPHRVVAEFVEVESGKSSAKRPQLREAVRRARRHGATLLVAKLDRLSRDLWLITTIQKFGIKFICADNPEINELTLHVLGAVAQHERRMISQRTRDALSAAKKRGVKLGHPRWKEVQNKDTTAANRMKSKIADIFAREIMEEIVRIREQGAHTLAAIALQLNQYGFVTRRKAAWTPTAVRRVLARKPSVDPLEDLLLL